MEPITAAILAALGKLAEPAVKDAYNALKELLSRKFTSVKSTVDLLEKEPRSAGLQAVLANEVQRSDAAHDEELLSLARQLLEKAGTPSAGLSVRQIVSGEGNIFSGTGSVTVNKS